MTPLQLLHVGPAQLDEVWPQVAEMLRRALLYTDNEISLSQLRMMVATGAAAMLVGRRDAKLVGAAVIEFLQYPNCRVANVVAMGGRQLWPTKDNYEQFRRWLIEHGASKLQGLCRPSAARLWQRWGMEQRYIVMRCDLWAEAAAEAPTTKS